MFSLADTVKPRFNNNNNNNNNKLEQKHKKNPMLLLLNGNSIRVNTRAEQWLCFSDSLSSARARAGHVFPDMSHTHAAPM